MNEAEQELRDVAEAQQKCLKEQLAKLHHIGVLSETAEGINEQIARALWFHNEVTSVYDYSDGARLHVPKYTTSLYAGSKGNMADALIAAFEAGRKFGEEQERPKAYAAGHSAGLFQGKQGVAK